MKCNQSRIWTRVAVSISYDDKDTQTLYHSQLNKFEYLKQPSFNKWIYFVAGSFFVVSVVIYHKFWKDNISTNAQ